MKQVIQQRPYTISVVMIVKNEADNLKRSLPAVADWVNEIIVLDSGSTDNSQAVAEQHGAKWFVNTDWQGFGKQKQLAQSYAEGDWILALDADEVVSSTLKDSILQATQNPPARTVYGVRRIDYIFGHPIDNATWLRALKAHWRLYPRQFGYNDNQVHESVDVSNAGNTLALSGYLHHHTADSPTFLLRKRLDYAATWATERHNQQKTVSIFGVMGHSLWAFCKTWLVEERFLMGRYGLIYAAIFTGYTFNKYAILYDLNRQQRG